MALLTLVRSAPIKAEMTFNITQPGLFQMNIKLLKYVKEEGYCCMWAWLETNKAKPSSDIMDELGKVCTSRALRYHRAAHRNGKVSCEELLKCLKLMESRKTP